MIFNGETLKLLREDQFPDINVAVGELYKKTKYATSYQNWQRWEDGQCPRGDALTALCKLFNKKPNFFYLEI